MRSIRIISAGAALNQDIELHELMRSIAEKSVLMLAKFNQQPIQLPTFIEKNAHLLRDYLQLMMILVKNPEQIRAMYQGYWQAVTELMQHQLKHWQEGKTMPLNDKRFSSAEWVNHPFFSALCQHYLLACEHTNLLLQRVDYDDTHVAKRVQFFTRQYLDALSPDNFLHTNPQLLTEIVQTQGRNLLHGLHNLLIDLETDTSRLNIKMTDTDAFKIGINLAITPGKVIFRNSLMELIQYTPQTPTVHAVPLLIIPPWINKYYILDLSPHNSLVRWLVSQGICVFVISWVNPGRKHANKGIEDYLHEGPIAAINTIQRQLKSKQINTLGFCIGGTLQAMLIAYYQTVQKNPIRSATFLAAMIDFSDPGDMSVFIDEQQITTLEKHMSEKGFLEGHVMANTFNLLRASDLIWSFFIKNYLRAKAPVPFDTLYWNADSTNMPAKMHSQYLRWMYLHNHLVKPGKLHINGTPLDLSNIVMPTFFVGTQRDHIAPWKTTYLGFQLMRGDKTFLLGGSGHIAGIVNPPSSEKYGFYRNNASPESADDWLAGAAHHQGSWWPDWLTWLKKQSGQLIGAPELAKLPVRPIMDAPGEYVLEVCEG